MTRNLDTFERVVRLLAAAFAFFAAAVLFHHPAVRFAAAAFGAYALWECYAAKCPLHAMLGVASPTDRLAPETVRLLGLLGVQVTLAYEWWSAGWGKLSNPDFLTGMGKTLAAFAAKNPYPWYKSFLENVAAKNATAFGIAVEWSQAVIAFVLVAAAVETLWGKEERVRRKAMLAASVALVGGMLMNANFYFAAGWTSASTKGSNMVMFWAQAALLYVWLRSFANSSPSVSGAAKR
jgi:hypothetical protein